MDTLTAIALLMALFTIIADVLLLIFWICNFRQYGFSDKDSLAEQTHPELKPMQRPVLTAYPRVAVLLAVRNEEALLATCIESLLASDYPSNQLEIWIGNDASEDNTLAIAQAWKAQDSRVRIVDVKEQAGDAKAKANVLAQLVLAVEQEKEIPTLMLVTDADMQVQTNWVRGMVHSWQNLPKKKEVGVVTGITLVKSETSWGQLQRIDWLFALGMVKVASDWGMPIATMGNNMMMYHPAYRATGGYENLAFSITEDFQILHQITDKGYGFRNVVTSAVVAFTQPMRSWGELLQQRKRWMHGAVRLPLPILVILFLQALFFPLILFLLYTQTVLGIGLWILKATLQSIFILAIESKLRLSKKYRNKLIRYLILYDVYSAIVTLLTLAIYILPTKTSWKGRKY